MKYDLNWDSTNNNGIVQNELYPQGVLFGADRRPTLSVVYDWFMYYESTNHFVIFRDGILQEMDSSLRAEVQLIAKSWVQTLGEEGNPTIEQMKQAKKEELRATLESAMDSEYQTGHGYAIPVDDVMLDHLKDLDVSNDGGIVIDTTGVVHKINKSVALKYRKEIAEAHSTTRSHYFKKLQDLANCSDAQCIDSIAW